jgi:non-homologous end joining protein Ku
VPVESEAAPGAKVIDFMEALKRSLSPGGEAPKRQAEKPKRKPPAKSARSKPAKPTSKRKAG